MKQHLAYAVACDHLALAGWTVGVAYVAKTGVVVLQAERPATGVDVVRIYAVPVADLDFDGAAEQLLAKMGPAAKT